jgi:hypothetical protein
MNWPEAGSVLREQRNELASKLASKNLIWRFHFAGDLSRRELPGRIRRPPARHSTAMPQRFYAYQQRSNGDRHMYGSNRRVGGQS